MRPLTRPVQPQRRVSGTQPYYRKRMEQSNQVLYICMHIQYSLFEGIINNGTLEFTLPGRIGEYCRQLRFYVVGVYGVRELPGTSVLVLLRFPRNAIFAQIRRSAGDRWINMNLLTAFRNGSIKQQQKCKYSLTRVLHMRFLLT